MNFVYILFVGVDKMVLHARASLFVLFGWHVFIPGSIQCLFLRLFASIVWLSESHFPMVVALSLTKIVS